MQSEDHTSIEPVSLLTEKARQASLYDAQGMSTKEIAEKLGVHENSIYRWRGKPEYQELKLRYQEGQMFVLDTILSQVRIDWADAGWTAREQLMASLTAEDAEGRPNWPVRLKAIDLWSNSPVLKSMIEIQKRADDRDGQAAVPEGAVTLIIKRDDDGDAFVSYEDNEEATGESRGVGRVDRDRAGGVPELGRGDGGGAGA